MISKEKTLLFMELADKVLTYQFDYVGRRGSKPKTHGRSRAETSLLSWLSSGVTDEELADLNALIDYEREHYHAGEPKPDPADLARKRRSGAGSDRQSQTAAILALLRKGVDLSNYLRYSLPLLSDDRTGE